MSELSSVAFDIETTGFATDDTLTVVGFDLKLGSRVFLNTAGRTRPWGLDTNGYKPVSDFDPPWGRRCSRSYSRQYEQRLTDLVDRPVSLSTHETENELLGAVAEFADAKLRHRDVKLVAYNGERWNGGFDLPFLRTRLSHHDADWPFLDLPYVDAMDVFETYFNTSEDTLEAVYEELIGDGLTHLDPFDKSSESVDAWESGDFDAIVLHNVADIRRTRALIRLAERYCSKSDFSMKSLDPVA